MSVSLAIRAGLVTEACEYDRSFLNLHPKIAVILNIEQDHLDYYKDEDDIVDAFVDFASGITDGGTVIVNGQDRNAATVLLSGLTGIAIFRLIT